LFENAAWGLAEILDVRRSSSGSDRQQESIDLGPADIEGLLVDWMNELIVRTEEGVACLTTIRVTRVGEEGLHALADLTDCGVAPVGTELKAATYHQLSVENGPEGWQATVYFDV